MRVKNTWISSLAFAILALLTWCAPIGAQPVFPIPLALDLPGDARAAHAKKIPLLLFITQANCPYCEQARRTVFAPMARELAATEPPAASSATKPVLLRELATGNNQLVKRFDGSRSSALSVAKSLGVHVFPTVLLLDERGARLVEPMEGLRIADFYPAYVDENIAEAHAKLLKSAAQ